MISFISAEDPNAIEGDIEIKDCFICYDEFSTTDNRYVVELDCRNKHVFHTDCVNKWFEKNTVCPLCKEEIKMN